MQLDFPHGLLGNHRELGRFQREREHLIDSLNDMKLHLVTHLGRDVIEVGLIALRDDHLSETCGVRGQHLLSTFATFNSARRISRPGCARH